MDSPLVSVITPTYNSTRFVRETVGSIQSQTCPNWEMLVTDDCSTDGTLELLRKIASEDPRVKIFSLEENSGAGVARNNSIKQAKGRFIAFCDSDDQWRPGKLEKQVRFMLENDLAFSHTSYDKINEGGVSLNPVQCFPLLTYADMLRNNYIGCLTAMYDTQKLGKVYMPEIRKRQDWALWLKIIKQCGEVRGLDEPLALYRERGGSISSNKIEMLKYNWIIYHEVERFGAVRTLWLMMAFMWSYFAKKTSER